MFSSYAVLVYLVGGAAAVLAAVDALLALRTARRPLTVVVLVLAIGLLLTLLTLPWHGAVVLVAGLTIALLVALIVAIATGRRRPLTIVAAAIAVLALLTQWPIVGLTFA